MPPILIFLGGLLLGIGVLYFSPLTHWRVAKDKEEIKKMRARIEKEMMEYIDTLITENDLAVLPPGASHSSRNDNNQ